MTAAPAAFDVTAPLPRGRVAVEASAGTGKTWTLAALAVRYVAEAAIPVGELLVVTFTRAAAAELRERIRSGLRDAADHLDRTPVTSDAPTSDDPLLAHLADAPVNERVERARRIRRALSEYDTATVSTIHAFCQQVLVALGSAAPGDPDATLVDDTDRLLDEVCSDLLVRTSTNATADPGTTTALPSADALRSDVGALLRNPDIVVLPPSNAPGVPPEVDLRARLAVEAAATVRARRIASGTLGYDDLLTRVRDALTADGGGDAVAALGRRFRVALIDEFQDTDPVQWTIFDRLFAARNEGDDPGPRALVLVGDPKQAIYAFRGADVHTFLEAAHGPDIGRATLDINHRADERLVQALGHLFESATFGDPRIAYIAQRGAHHRPGLTDHQGASLPPVVLRPLVGGDSATRKNGEALYTGVAERVIAADVASQIRRLLDTTHLPVDGSPPVSPGDVAVLVGTHREAPVVAAALARHGVPATISRVGSVFATEAADHWRILLAALTRPSDPARARAAALTWFCGWTADRLDRADDLEVAGLQARLHEWAQLAADRGIAALLRHLFDRHDLAARLLQHPDGDRHLTDVEHIGELLHVRSVGCVAGVHGLLTTFDELASGEPDDAPDDAHARRIDTDAAAVQIMTVHGAKGLQFPVVCCPFLWRARRGDRTCVFHDGAHRVVEVDNHRLRTMTLRDQPDRDLARATRDAARRHHALAEAEARGENLRLAYVGLTRAQHQVIVWWADTGRNHGTGITRLLFARHPDGTIDPDQFHEPKVDVPPDDEVVDRLAVLASRAAGGIGIDAVDVADRPPPERPWSGRPHGGATEVLDVARFTRVLDRPRLRWSFTTMASAAADDGDLLAAPAVGTLVAADPHDDALGDRGADDEAVAEPAEWVPPPESAVAVQGPTPTDRAHEVPLPLASHPASAAFGTLVHRVLDGLDTTHPRLSDLLSERVAAAARWWGEPLDCAALVDGLTAAVSTPLGPLAAGRSLTQLGPTDRLDELSFELPLAAPAHRVPAGALGAVLLDHLDPRDPLRAWATDLAGGRIPSRLTGHLVGSIDAVIRVPHGDDQRFLVVDYKTNRLGSFDRPTRLADYHPDRLAAAMVEHHYPLQALLYSVALHRYLRWRLPGYDPARHLGGVCYLFLRGMIGPRTPTVGGTPHGVFAWHLPPATIPALSDLLHGSAPPSRSAGGRA